MPSLTDTVALSLWSLAARRRQGPPFHPLLATSAPRAGDDPPDSLPAMLECAGACASESLARDLREQAQAALERARAAGIDPVPWGDARYPPLLAAIPDPPVVLWTRGDAGCLARPAVAVVGSRAASEYGLEAASRLAGELAGAGMVIVSGLARGVDSAAHRGALGADGLTVAVLGSGVDVIYPAEHASLATAIALHGAVVSEYPPGTPPLPQYFPLRNRIISGLCLGVVVIEAAERSGSLITANCASDQGREVMAVPGNILSGRFRGSHALLRDGAAVVDEASDVLAELGRSSLQALSCKGPGGEPLRDPVLAAMAAGEAYDLDALALGTGLAPPALLPRLLDLELRGWVRRVGGGRFMRAR
jgi:DNA processing protein